MAKKKKADGSGSETKRPSGLDTALSAFERGNYPLARRLLNGVLGDPQLSEGAKDEARRRIAATRIDPKAAWTGLAAIALFGVVILITRILQP